MRRVVLAIVAWAARVAVWGTLLSLALYISRNHQGIGVRGQLACIGTDADGDQVLASLLERAGLAHLLETFDGGSHCAHVSGPLTCLLSHPVALTLYREPVDPVPWRLAVVIFDGDGAPVGAPIIPQYPAHGGPVTAPFQVLQAASAHWLVIYERSVWATTRPTTAPTTLQRTYHVFRLGKSDSIEVFTIRCDLPTNQWAYLELKPREDNGLALELQVWAPARGRNLQTVATHVWDQQLGRFVGQQSDPQGRWEVILREPDDTGL